MTNLLKRYQFELILWAALLGAFLITRLINLDLIPIFTDEAIYLRWSQIMANDAAFRYLPLVDGKPPLFMWLTALVMRAAPSIDLLLTGRLVSVGAGLFALFGIYFASWQLFKNKTISYLSAFLYVVLPITLFYDRFGLADSLFSAFGIWAFGLSAMLFRKPRLDTALLLGGTIGMAFLTKNPAPFYLILLPLFILLFNLQTKNWRLTIIKLVGSLAVVVILSQAIFGVLRLFPLFHMIAQKNSEFVVPLGAFIKEPFAIFPSTFQTLVRWEMQYLTLPLALFLLVAVIFGLKHKFRETLLLAGFFAGWLIAMSSFNKVIFPRYLVPLNPVLIMLLASGAYYAKEKLKSKGLAIGIGFLLLLPALFTDAKLLTDPVNANIADGDLNQYMSAWPAGYGVKEINLFLKAESKKHAKITVGTEGTFGLMPYAIDIYQQKEFPNVKVISYWPMPEVIPAQLLVAAKDHPTYFVVYQRQDLPPLWRVKLISEFQQGKGTDKLRLYEIEN